ncbi:hypothetical protein VC83_09653 [Pseudogymnoascus destructans]|uniref:DDE-1 domain-containing protein n=1 Tax=Pseudogymnoascus destructans TaxID=655981 RepID=A0A2P6FGM0_9PEZI|nr:uncharacterized protein VC83_09653 [Pseudogymnoascus destructans]PQM43526.1 hypothetical protein VC83_09653 [Pseudogymnoascus destructans]
MVFTAIGHLRAAEILPKPAPSWRWFQSFIKSSSILFRVVKTKPIAQVRVTTHDISAVQDWFGVYLAWCTQHNIQPQDIYNFDETGFRVGVAPGEDVIVPVSITEMYVPMAENRKSITVIESICAVGQVLPPIIIVYGILV